MGAKAVFGIAADEAQALAIIQDLKTAGFRNDDISALVPDRTGTLNFGFERHTKAPEGASWGGLLGVLVGAGVGWALGAGWLQLPPGLLAESPVSAGLSAASLGAVGGALLGALFGARRAEYEAKRFRGRIDGNILLSACCASFRATRIARRIFRDGQARDIGVAPLRAGG